LRIHFRDHVINLEVQHRMGQPPVTVKVVTRRLSLFGHIAHADPAEDHVCALSACVDVPPKDWKWPQGRPRHMWLQMVEQHLRPQHLGLWTALQQG